MTIIDPPVQFKTGCRILMRTLRGKDGGKISRGDRFAEKIVTSGVEDFDKAFKMLQSKLTGKERIYSTIDERDIEKGIRLFKERQLAADYDDQESHNNFYLDIENRFISSLQNPRSRKGTLFLVDIDNGVHDERLIREEIEQKWIEVVYDYKTKNGRHLILKPFNPSTVSFKVLNNSMLLLAY